MTQDQTDPYTPLRQVLDEAFEQASGGKGKERHAQGRPFLRQPILEIGRMVGPGFEVGQAMKKGQEALGFLTKGAEDAERRACVELLGAINYLAAAVILIRERTTKAGQQDTSFREQFHRKPSGEIVKTIQVDGKPATHFGGGVYAQEIPAEADQGTEAEQDAAPPQERLILRALTPEDVGRRVRLRDGQDAIIEHYFDDNREHPYKVARGEGLMRTTSLVNQFGEQETGRWNPSDVGGVYEPAPTREEQLYGKESKRANIGIPSELSTRFLCREDIGKQAFRRDGTSVVISGFKAMRFVVSRNDGKEYFVQGNGFLVHSEQPNAADIRQVILG